MYANLISTEPKNARKREVELGSHSQFTGLSFASAGFSDSVSVTIPHSR